MALLTVHTFPDPVLKQKALPVDEFDEKLSELAENMLETMYAGDGLGLAAIQIGVPKRVMVVDVHRLDDPPAPIKMINPVITWFSPERIVYQEGCLSFPEYFADIERAAEVRVSYLDENGEAREVQASETLAVCLQHEVDHLDGKLFVDHLSLVKRNIILRKMAKARRAKVIDA